MAHKTFHIPWYTGQDFLQSSLKKSRRKVLSKGFKLLTTNRTSVRHFWMEFIRWPRKFWNAVMECLQSAGSVAGTQCNASVGSNKNGTSSVRLSNQNIYFMANSHYLRNEFWGKIQIIRKHFPRFHSRTTRRGVETNPSEVPGVEIL